MQTCDSQVKMRNRHLIARKQDTVVQQILFIQWAAMYAYLFWAGQQPQQEAEEFPPLCLGWQRRQQLREFLKAISACHCQKPALGRGQHFSPRTLTSLLPTYKGKDRTKQSPMLNTLLLPAKATYNYITCTCTLLSHCQWSWGFAPGVGSGFCHEDMYNTIQFDLSVEPFSCPHISILD